MMPTYVRTQLAFYCSVLGPRLWTAIISYQGQFFFFFFPLQIFSELYVANGTFSLTTKVKDQVYITANWEYNFRTAILKLLVLENWPPNKELYIYFMCTLQIFVLATVYHLPLFFMITKNVLRLSNIVSSFSLQS